MPRSAAAHRRHKKLEARIHERTVTLSDLNRELRTANDVLRQSSQTDSLTGLVNRRFFDDNSRKSISAELADRGVVMIIYIDFFKHVNDAYGHAAGDYVLCRFANVLRSCMRQSDLVIRWGGEEFVTTCRCPNDDAVAVLERLCAAVREHFFSVPSGKRVNLTCSIGCIRYPLWGNISPDERMSVLLELSDAALYEVKMGGRDSWALLEDGPTALEKPHSRQIGPRLDQLIEADHLV